jgi:hypothetical protein
MGRNGRNGNISPEENQPGYAEQFVDAIVSEVTERVVARLQDVPAQRFLSKRALADHLGVTERRIKTLRERGLPARKIGGDLYFEVNEVAEFIDREAIEAPFRFQNP